MEKRYYAGIMLEKDLTMCQVFDELKKNPEVIITDHGRTVEVVEMVYDTKFSSDRIATGKTHVGFDFFYIIFKYRGLDIHINPSTYYPFTDENEPGKINFVIYQNGKQCSYLEKYDNIKDVDNWIRNNPIITPVK